MVRRENFDPLPLYCWGTGGCPRRNMNAQRLRKHERQTVIYSLNMLLTKYIFSFQRELYHFFSLLAVMVKPLSHDGHYQVSI